MGSVRPEAVMDSLRGCMDPEVPINIVDMGLVYGVDVADNDNVSITMTMTTRGCPLHDTLVSDVTRYAKRVPGVNAVKVDVVWDPPWTMDKLSADARRTLDKMRDSMAGPLTPAPINYETATPQGVGKLVKQDDGSMVLANEHDQGFMVNQAIVDFWRSCNGQRRITELVEAFAGRTGLQRGQVEKEVLQLVNQLRDGGLLVIPGAAGGSSSAAAGEKSAAPTAAAPPPRPQTPPQMAAPNTPNVEFRRQA